MQIREQIIGYYIPLRHSSYALIFIFDCLEKPESVLSLSFYNCSLRVFWLFWYAAHLDYTNNIHAL